MKYVVQYKCTGWVNAKINGDTRYFESLEEAREFAKTYRSCFNDGIPNRIAEYHGGRKYKEIEVFYR